MTIPCAARSVTSRPLRCPAKPATLHCGPSRHTLPRSQRHPERRSRDLSIGQPHLHLSGLLYPHRQAHRHKRAPAGARSGARSAKDLDHDHLLPVLLRGLAPERFIVKARLVEDQALTGGTQPAAKPAPTQTSAKRTRPPSKPIASAQHQPRHTWGISHSTGNSQLADLSSPTNSGRHIVRFWHKLAKLFTRRSD